MRYFPSLLIFTLLCICSAQAPGTLEAGADIDVKRLMNHLGVQSYSFNFVGEPNEAPLVSVQRYIRDDLDSEFEENVLLIATGKQMGTEPHPVSLLLSSVPEGMAVSIVVDGGATSTVTEPSDLMSENITWGIEGIQGLELTATDSNCDERLLIGEPTNSAEMKSGDEFIEETLEYISITFCKRQ